VPPVLRGVIARAMAKQPADRPPDGNALATMLPPVSGGDDRTPLQAIAPASIASTAPVALDRTQPAVFGPTEPAVIAQTERAVIAPTERATITPTEPVGIAPTERAVIAPTERAVPIVTTAEAPLRRKSRALVLLAALAALVAAAIFITAWTLAADRSPSSGLITDTTAAPSVTTAIATTTTAAPTSTTAPTAAAATIVVDPGDYLGRKADKAAKDLDRLGFDVEQEVVERGDRRPGVVIAVQPSGRLREGSTVTLVVTASGNEN
jgi:serine/threonine-protein kinase